MAVRWILEFSFINVTMFGIYVFHRSLYIWFSFPLKCLFAFMSFLYAIRWYNLFSSFFLCPLLWDLVVGFNWILYLQNMILFPIDQLFCALLSVCFFVLWETSWWNTINIVKSALSCQMSYVGYLSLAQVHLCGRVKESDCWECNPKRVVNSIQD